MYKIIHSLSKENKFTYLFFFCLVISLSFSAFKNPVEITDEDWVLINGVKWATRNVDMPGAFAANPEDAGMYYQWNRKVGWSTTDPIVNSDGGTEWDYPEDECVIWEKHNDPCPEGWRVPTETEIQSLTSVRVNRVWTTENGVNGCRFTDISSGNSIFLPAAGYRYSGNGTLVNVGISGFYQSNTQCTATSAYIMFLNRSYPIVDFWGKESGNSIRPVAE